VSVDLFANCWQRNVLHYKRYHCQAKIFSAKRETSPQAILFAYLFSAVVRVCFEAEIMAKICQKGVIFIFF